MAKKSITKNYIYNLIYQILILVLPLVTTPYISRVLGATNIGIYSYTYSIVSYFILFGALGVSMYGQREIAYAGEDVNKRKKIFYEIIAFRFVTVFIALLIYTLFFMINGEYSIYYRIWALELIATAVEISWFFILELISFNFSSNSFISFTPFSSICLIICAICIIR